MMIHFARPDGLFDSVVIPIRKWGGDGGIKVSIGEKAGDIEKQGDKFVFVSRMRNLPLLEKVEDSNGKIIRIRVAR